MLKEEIKEIIENWAGTEEFSEETTQKILSLLLKRLPREEEPKKEYLNVYTQKQIGFNQCLSEIKQLLGAEEK